VTRRPALPATRGPARGGKPSESVAPQPRPFLSWRTLDPLWIAVPILIATRLWFARVFPEAAEDAYITFRYARNLAEGLGMVYNPGERVMGFTSPLWTLWCGVGSLLLQNPKLWARAGSLVADLATLLLVSRILATGVGRTAAGCFAFAFAAWPYFAAVSVSGMEMSAMLALIALSAWLVGRGSRWAGVGLGALTWMRPEGIACAAVLGIAARWRDRLVGMGLLAIGLVILTIYYGSPIPQSVAAKAWLYGTPGPWAGRHWWEWLSPAEFGRWPTTQEGLQLFMLRIVLGPACVLGAWKLRSSSLRFFAGACLVVWLGYVTLGVAYFWWYLLVPLAGLFFLAAAALPDMVRGHWLYVTLIVAIAGTWSVQPQKIYGPRASEENRLFGRSATWLAGQAKPGESVLLEPIGIIGYEVPQLRVIDETGLVTPGIATLRRRGPGWYADAIREHQPDWIVIRYGVLATLEAFAGAGAPFRTESERDSLIRQYQLMFTTSSDPRPNDFGIGRRVAPR
jgi:hypothetical protein